MENERREKEVIENGQDHQEPAILDEIDVEELAVDGICGIY